MNNDGGLGFVAVALAVVASIAVGVMWAAAALLGGAAPSEPTTDAVFAIVFQQASATQAWGIDGRSNAVYWTLVAVLAALVLLAGSSAFTLLWSSHWGTKRRTRLGSETESRFADRRDLEPLWDTASGGRFLLGATRGVAGSSWRSKRLATEWRADPMAKRLSRQAGLRAGDRGAVAIVGPSRSGKTVTALTGVLGWEGPVILSSVKDDLLEPTLANRRRRGEVAVFDPTEYLLDAYRAGNAPQGWDERLRVSWSPLHDADTFVGAGRAARGLSESGPESTDGHNAMWVGLAEQLIQGLLFVAACEGATMRSVVRWISHQDQPATTGDEGEVWPILELLLDHRDPRMQREAAAAFNSLNAVWSQDPKIVSSVYTTATSIVQPWQSPAVADSAGGACVDLDWLCSGANSLYLVAPPQDAKRLGPVFGGAVNALLEQCFAKVARDGKPIDPPILVLLDEAGNLPLQRLPEFASTVAGLGVQLVTVWQSLAQIKDLYGTAADTVISNHLTKVVYTGVSDESTLEYLQKITGEEEVETTVNSDDKWRFWAGSTQLQGTRLGLTPNHVIRTMPRGHALLIHGSLLPAHIHAVPWYEQKSLVAQQCWTEGDERGLPLVEPQDSLEATERSPIQPVASLSDFVSGIAQS